MEEATFSILNKTRGITPRIPFEQIKNAVLGADYTLSLALLSPSEARRVTKETKGIDKASNVLSFPLSKNSGEVLICPATAREQAPLYGQSVETFLARLFIHGLLHLKGMRHGATMDKAEIRILREFGFQL